METRILQIETPEQFERAAAEAVRLLKQGEIVALPTETVYGLAANAFDPEAVQRIYTAKGRPVHNPIIVHVSSLQMALRCVRDWPVEADKLAREFWPGPLTLVLPRSSYVPDIVTGGGRTVGVRFPLHPLMRRVIQGCDFPLAAPSANLANQLSPTTGEHVWQSLKGKVPLIIDAGPSSVGIESTVLDLSGRTPRILRPGMISGSRIGRILGVLVGVGSGEGPSVRKSPGQLPKHYSPKARLMVAKWTRDMELEGIASQSGVEPGAIHVLTHDRIPHANPFGRVAIVPHDPEAYARALYAELHRSDALGAALIIIEAPPSGEEWDGIQDRLNRASA